MPHPALHPTGPPPCPSLFLKTQNCFPTPYHADTFFLLTHGFPNPKEAIQLPPGG